MFHTLPMLCIQWNFWTNLVYPSPGFLGLKGIWNLELWKQIPGQSALHRTIGVHSEAASTHHPPGFFPGTGWPPSHLARSTLWGSLSTVTFKHPGSVGSWFYLQHLRDVVWVAAKLPPTSPSAAYQPHPSVCKKSPQKLCLWKLYCHGNCKGLTSIFKIAN